MPAKAVIVCLASSLAVLVGCDLIGPQLQFSHAATMLQCGPADEPYTRIVLASEPVTSTEAAYPNVHVVIWQSVREIASHTFSVTRNVGAGAWYVTGPNKVESALSGSVTVTSVDSTDTVEGSLALRFPSRVVETPFTAPWINNGMLCN